MRKYKFRGKTPDRVQWVYGSLIILEDGDCLIKEIDYLRNICPEYRVLPDTVGQFTGHFDLNENEIYEGDLVQCGSGRICVVDFFKSSAECCFDLTPIARFDCPAPKKMTLWEDLTVIGNKFDDLKFIL